LRLAFDLSITNRLANSEDEVDFIYYNLPKLPINKVGYTFPSMCIGYESLFRAFRFLQNFRQNKDNNSFLSKEFSTEYISHNKELTNWSEKQEPISVVEVALQMNNTSLFWLQVKLLNKSISLLKAFRVH